MRTREEVILEKSKNITCKYCGNPFRADQARYDAENDEYVVSGKCPKCMWDNTKYRLFLCTRKRVCLP